MISQSSFSHAEFAVKKKTTRREKFLGEMERLVPWARLVAVIIPFYPTGRRGRPPIGIERMLRMYFLQQWFSLADEALEDAIYDSLAMRIFAGIDLSSESVPDATTLLKFRHLLEEHDLSKAIFDEIAALLHEQKLLMKQGTIVDATIIEAPVSTKNRAKARDPEMRHTKKGLQWHFGLKAHIGADMESGLVHTVVVTPAQVSDVTQTRELLHGEEKECSGDAGYQGVEKREEMADIAPRLTFHIAAKRGQVKAMPEGKLKDLTLELEKLKAQVRAVVEHPFHVIKNLFLHRKVRYRGLKKNLAQLHTLFGLANLVIAKRALRAQMAA